MNIIELAKNRNEIMASQDIKCFECGEKQFSPFDKLYVTLNNKCIDCTEASEIEKNSNYIFQIIS